MNGHTPTPWHLGAMNDALFVIDAPPRPSNDDVVHEHGAEPIARFTKDADAAFAVRAVNAHVALVEALERAMQMCRCSGTGKYTRRCTLCGDSTFDHECNDEERACERTACVAARAALKLAGVGS